MAIPTAFGDITPSAGTTTTFPLPGLTSYGIDVAGTQTPTAVRIANKMTIVMEQTYTDAELVAALVAFLKQHGAAHDGPGGSPVASVSVNTPATTVCT